MMLSTNTSRKSNSQMFIFVAAIDSWTTRGPMLFKNKPRFSPVTLFPQYDPQIVLWYQVISGRHVGRMSAATLVVCYCFFPSPCTVIVILKTAIDFWMIVANIAAIWMTFSGHPVNSFRRQSFHVRWLLPTWRPFGFPGHPVNSFRRQTFHIGWLLPTWRPFGFPGHPVNSFRRQSFHVRWLLPTWRPCGLHF